MSGSVVSRVAVAVLISSLLLLLVPAGGTAATIRGCVSRSGTLTIPRQKNGRCKRGQRAITWNQRGPAGPAGGWDACLPAPPANRGSAAGGRPSFDKPR